MLSLSGAEDDMELVVSKNGLCLEGDDSSFFRLAAAPSSSLWNFHLIERREGGSSRPRENPDRATV